MNRFTFVVLFFVFAGVLLTLPPFVSAAEVCGSTCPAQCSEAGSVCVGEERPGSGSTVRGSELTCVQKQNVGCSVKLGWPFIAGNSCPQGFEHDSVIDGPVDCGFLGLGAVFGGAAKFCHAERQVACSSSSSCPSGFTVESTRSCSTQVQGSATSLQCCQITRSPPVNPPGDTDDEDEVSPTPGGVTLVSVRPAFVAVGPSQEVQFTAVGVTPSGSEYDLSEVEWALSTGNKGEISEEGLFTACSECTGNLRVLGRVGPLVGSADVRIVDLANYHIEPASATLSRGALGFFYSTATQGAGGERVNVSSRWSASIGELRSSGDSVYAVLLASEAGRGFLNATASLLKAAAAITLVETAGPVASLSSVPSSIVLNEGDQQQVSVFAHDANGVFVPLPEGLAFNIADASVAQLVPGDNIVRGRRAGSTTLAISAGGVSISVPVTVNACRAGNTVRCTETDAWNSVENGPGLKTCSESQTWSACVRENQCAGSRPVGPNPVSDGVACPAFCSNPSVNDPDCTCTAGQRVACTDASTSCWGVMFCSADGRFSSCVPSDTCLGGLEGRGAGGVFNGFICASTATVPSPLNLAAVSACRRFGEAVVRAVVSPESCERTVEKVLEFNVEDVTAVDQVVVAEGAAGNGVKTFYRLADVSTGGVRLEVLDPSGESFVQTLLVGQSLRFNAAVTLNSLALPAEGSEIATGRFTFNYNSCARQLTGPLALPAS